MLAEIVENFMVVMGGARITHWLISFRLAHKFPKVHVIQCSHCTLSFVIQIVVKYPTKIHLAMVTH